MLPVSTHRCLVLIISSLSFGTSQQVYIPAPAEPSSLTCTVPASQKPSFRFSSFSFTQTETVRTATSITRGPTSTYAAPYSKNSNLIGKVSSTTWPNWSPGLPLPTIFDGRYGNQAYSNLWDLAAPLSFSRGLYSTTVSPTPVPSSELVYPPPLVFPPTDCYAVPNDFILGIAGSASQCEGAVADSGKAPSIMDMLGNLITLSGTNGINDYVTNEHYYLYKQDIERFAAIGAKVYYFTISWARIMPFAIPGTPVNVNAIQHYSDMIDYVLAKGMKPIVALTHFDTPLQFFGGGLGYVDQFSKRAYYGAGMGLNLAYDNATFEDAFVNYAKIVLAHYADRVPYWVSFNEPQVGTINGPAVNSVLKAHARVVHFYRDQLKGTGKFTIKSAIAPAIPLRPSNQSHVNAAFTFNELYIGALLRPLVLGQDYPTAFKTAIQDYVPLSASDLKYMKGTLDFTSVDTYGAPILYPVTPSFPSCATDNSTSNPLYRFPICLGLTRITANNWSIGYDPAGSAINWLAPSYLRTQLNYLWNTYKLPVLVSEFGLETPLPTGGDQLVDNVFNVPQSEFIIGNLREMLRAIWEDGVNVMGALVWNWGDDWEFRTFDTGFGLQFVNRTTQQRVYRRSFFDVLDYVESRRLKA